MDLTFLFVIVTVAAVSSALGYYFAQKPRIKSESINQALERIYGKFIDENNRNEVFDALLTEVLTLTNSEYGFIGEVLYKGDGTPFLKTRAITNIAWDDETQALYEKYAEQGLEFYNLQSLFGAAITSEQTVISNNPDKDDRRTGLPEGHPPMTAFMGVALKIQGKMVGLIGIANAPRGYSQQVEDELSPISYSIAQLIYSCQLVQKQHDADEKILANHSAELREELQKFFDLSPDFMCIAHVNGTFKKVNNTFKRKLGHSPKEFINQPFIKWVHPHDIAQTYEAMRYLGEGNEVANFVNRYRTATGEYLSLQWRAMPDPNSGEIYATAEDVTESLRVMHEVKRLSRIANEIPSVALITDTEGRITWANKAFERVTGYTLDEVIGRKPGDFLQGTLTDPNTVDDIRRAIRAVEPFSVEIQNYTKDGHPYWVEIDCQPLLNESGAHEGFLAVQSDITARVNTQAALEYRSKVLEQMSYLGNIGAWEFDIDAGHIFWSDETCRIHGVASGFEATTEQALSFIADGEERRLIEALIKQSIAKGEPWQHETQIIRQGGELRWVLVSCKAEFVQGTCKKLYGAYQDIHERKLHQLANIKTLAHSQALATLTLDKHVLKGDFEQAAVAVVKACAAAIAADRVSVWQFDNTLSEMYQIALFDSGKITVNTGVALTRNDYPEYFTHVYQHTFVNASDARNHPATIEFTEPYLEPLGIYSLLDAVISGRDHFVGVVCIEQYGGVREWNNAEEAFVCALATLLSSVYDRQQRKITEQALKETAAKANAAAQAKSDFLASMSHEIRTPMNGVLGMLRLILKTPLSGDQGRKVKIALNSAESLLTIINDILDFSRIDAGKLALELMDFDLVALFTEFTETMAFRAEEHHLTLHVNLDGVTSPYVIGDPGRLRQILTNLVGNALKFTPQGEIVIAAKTREQEGNVILECSVTDTGIGIPQDKQSDLFEQFTQVDTSNTRQYGGTGLGLSIVKNLCEAMGGRVWVESDEGQGSCFSFTTQFEKNTAPELKLPTIDLTGKRVLLVDDNATNQQVMAEPLAQCGCETYIADCANKAIQICEQVYDAGQTLDIALLDMQMPGTDGATLGRMLKEDKRFGAIPLVMMTSQAQRGDAAEFAELGFSAYFPKPVDSSVIVDAMMVILDGKILPYAKPIVTRHFIANLERSSQAAARANYQWSGKPRILLVEDNRINQEVVIDQLIDMGLGADVAGDGQEAIHALAHAPAAHPYKLVLMDCQMPVMDGFAATEAIRRGEAGDINRDITIIALTANAMAGDKERCLAIGMNDYISKPIDPDVLEAHMVQWLKHEPTVQTQTDAASAGTTIPAVTLEDSCTEESVGQLLAEPAPLKSALAPNQPNGTVADQSTEAAAKNGIKVWDVDGALKRVRGRRDRLAILTQRYTEQTPELIADIFRCVEGRDLSHAAELCHSLRGVAANLGAQAVTETCQNLENACLDGDCDVARLGAGELLIHNDQFVKALRQFTV